MSKAIPGNPGCMMADTVNRHTQERIDARDHEALVNKAIEDFRTGRPLAEIARDLQALGLATDNDVAYIENLPGHIHDQIHGHIRSCVDRERPLTVFISHTPADEFEVRLEEHEDGRHATLHLHGPHH